MTDDDLNRALAIWGRTDLADESAVERLLANARPARRPRWPFVAGGMGIAAAAALAMLAVPTSSPRIDPTPTATADVRIAGTDDPAIDSFLALYTPTSEEELFL